MTATPPPKYTLCLDLGANTGFAIFDGERRVTSGTAKFPQSRFQGGGFRFVKFGKWLAETHKIAPLKEVYFEEVRRHLGTDAAHIYGGFVAVLTAWCEESKIPYSGVPVGTIKKAVTGRGNANKQAVMDAVAAAGYPISDDNEADAVAIALWNLRRAG